MGAQLVALVFARWTHLNDTAFRILLRMALTALDEEKDGKPPKLYFGGHELLAMALRRPFPQGDSEQARKARQNVLRDVRRAVKDLVDKCAIEGVDTGRAVRQGEAKTYRLTLWNGAGVLTPSSAGGENPSSAGGENPSSAGGENPREQGVRTPPRNHGGTTEEPCEEDRADTGEQPQDARAPEDDHEPPALRLVDTAGVRDPTPPGGGVPGQMPLVTSTNTAAPEDTPEDPEAPYHRCANPKCGRRILRSRRICPHCFLEVKAS